jgi:S1-C subfamily serine protease
MRSRRPGARAYRCLGLAVLGALALFLPVALAQESDDPPEKQALALQQHVQKLIGQVEPSIACVLVSRSEDYQRFGQELSLGQPGKLGKYLPDVVERHLQKLGLAADKRQQILHRLDLADPDNVPEASKVFVRLVGSQGSYADILAADPRSDLAVLRLLSSDLHLKTIPFGDGAAVKRGQFVLCLAHPFAAGFQDGQCSASWGMISNIRRRAPGRSQASESRKTLYHFGTLLQTDARITCGSSGGVLLNLKGDLIAITTSLAATQGLDVPGGFAVPLTDGLKRIIGVLRKGEEVEYGFLGLRVDQGSKRTSGVVIGSVTPGGPADKAGLKRNDVILAVDQQRLQRADDLFLALGTELAGTTIKLEVRRAGSVRTEVVPVILAKYYMPGQVIATVTRRPFFRGVRVDDTSLLVQQDQSADPPERVPPGVLVTEVQTKRPGGTVVLRTGEIITHVNNQPVQSPSEFYAIVRNIQGPVELTILNPQPGQAPAKVVLN